MSTNLKALPAPSDSRQQTTETTFAKVATHLKKLIEVLEQEYDSDTLVKQHLYQSPEAVSLATSVNDINLNLLIAF